MEIKLNNIKLNVPLCRVTTMRVGGDAHFFIEPKSVLELIKTIKYCKKNKIKYYILGNGSNVIFSDDGYDGMVICTKKLNQIKIRKNIVICQCGVNLFVLNKTLIKNALSGMEFSFGIPGTIGGAVCMNAGAYGSEMKDVVQKVVFFDGKKIKILKNKKLNFSYRNSIFKNSNYIILKVYLKLTKNNEKTVEEKCMQNFKKRQISQPLEFFNSGSIFKKSNGVGAGKIIDELGLKGLKVGGAEVSSVHANFIINRGNATSNDIKNLVEQIKDTVKQKSGITLEEEVIFIP